MHNSPEQNLRFAIAFNETNLRYLYGAHPLNKYLIAWTTRMIAKNKSKLETLLNGEEVEMAALDWYGDSPEFEAEMKARQLNKI